MLTTVDIDLPAQVRDRLRERAAFSETLSRFARRRTLGFEQPVAAASALILPILIAFVYAVSDFVRTIEVAVTFCVITLLFLGGAWFANREIIRTAYIRSVRARRRARSDLRAGRATETRLERRSPALFLEHDGGVMVFAAVSPDQTVFFDVADAEDDPRWFLYLNGDMHRAHWRWLKLRGSGAIADFAASGQRLVPPGTAPFLQLKSGPDTIAHAFNDPADGELIAMPYDEVERAIRRML